MLFFCGATCAMARMYDSVRGQLLSLLACDSVYILKLGHRATGRLALCFDGFASLGIYLLTHTTTGSGESDSAKGRCCCSLGQPGQIQIRGGPPWSIIHGSAGHADPRQRPGACVCIVLCVLCSHAWSSACGRVSAGALYIDAHDSSGFCALFVGAGCYMESEQKEELVPVAARCSSLIAYSECLRIDWEWTSFYQATWTRCSSCRT